MTTAENQNWRSIRDELNRRIAKRIWLPGELIPGEVELAEEFGCARATVNRALRELASTGLLDRRRRAGTRVARHPVRKATFSIPITRIEVEDRGAAWSHRVLSNDRLPAPAQVAERLGIKPGQDLLHQTSVHFADREPFVLEDRWISIDTVPGILDVDFSHISANEWLVQNVAFTRGDFVLCAANASRTEADILDTKPGAALFIVERTTWNLDMPITSVRLAYAPGYQVRMEI
ncbi:MAG: UTRA domain-containing protein [Rhodobiaceae bacterium]|nr:UTRA domain-containing protein [Rhodobiaceae bacterium]MCC0041687.1 UTRA domain-containing protein [Rhodobiaceae bacterium]MCC0053064.1 UTRA domain-containing protein [Rhodobiaceae bacterium]